MKIYEGIGGEGGSWFEESIQRKVDNGFTTYFCTDCWVGAVPFRERFERLFDLFVHVMLGSKLYSL